MQSPGRVSGPGDPDQDGFRREVDPFRRELLAHCYRMIGSLHDAEDAYQELLVRAWRARDRFEGRSSLRTWLHRIATNVCLDAIADRKDRLLPEVVGPAGSVDAPLPGVDPEAVWLEPYPDDLIGDTALGPEARYSARESVTIAFMIALHLLPGRQRAVLLMRDVLGQTADETGDALEMTVAAVNSALQRARATLESRGAAVGALPPATAPGDLLVRYVKAWESGDTAALVSVLRADAINSMPPMPLWFAGADAIVRFFTTVLAPRGPYRAIAIKANGQPGFAMYAPADGGGYLPSGISVLSVAGDRIAAIHTFLALGPDQLAAFGLPARLE